MSETIVKLKPEVLSLSAKIDDAYKLDQATGSAEITNGKIYTENLPEGITEETILKLNEYNAEFIAGLAHSFGMRSADAFKATADLTKTKIAMPAAGKDVVNVQVDRDYTTPQGNTIHGTVSASFDVYADGNRGQLKLAKQTVRARCTELLGS